MSPRLKFPHKNVGFTLIELLVVISIISLLSSIVLAGLKGARDRAQRSAFVQELVSVRTALAIYRTSHGDVPHCTDSTIDAATCFSSTLLNPLIAEGIISKIPSTGPGVVRILYETGIRDTTLSVTTDTKCGLNSIVATEWQPGTLLGTIQIFHTSGLDFGLPHTRTRCITTSGLCTNQNVSTMSCLDLY